VSDHMKLLHVTMYYFPVIGGQQVYIRELNKILKNDFSKIEIVQPSIKTNQEWPKNILKIKRLPIIFRVINCLNWLWFNFMLFFKKKYIKKFDIVITHYPFHFNMTKVAKKNIIVSHGVEWNNPKKSLCDFYREKMAHTVFESQSTIVANDTDFIRKIGVDILPATGEFSKIQDNVWYIPNCIDIDYYKPLNTRDVCRNNIILVPRNIRKDRGIHFAIEILYHLRKFNNKMTMLISGGPLRSAYYRRCISLIDRLDLKESVFFSGSKSQHELRELYYSSQIVLIPTLDKEGTSLSALESMSCGTATFSTSIGGLSDLPTVKIDLDPCKAAVQINKKLNKLDEISSMQCTRTRNTFNYSNWSAAWKEVIREAQG